MTRMRDTLENMSNWLLLRLNDCHNSTLEGKMFLLFPNEMAKLEELGLTVRYGNGYQTNEAGKTYLEVHGHRIL